MDASQAVDELLAEIAREQPREAAWNGLASLVKDADQDFEWACPHRRRDSLSSVIATIAPIRTPSEIIAAALTIASPPRRIEPMKALVLVLTPSIDVPGATSST
jgi:hypothetical protein